MKEKQALLKPICHKIDHYKVQIFSCDRVGARKRWGDKLIELFSEGQCIAQAVFACEKEDIPEPYVSGDKIFYFAHSSQYEAVLDLLRNEDSVYICWRPISDPKEPRDGDAFFSTEEG